MNRTIRNILGAATGPKGIDMGILLLRVLAGAMMISHGLAKVANYAEISAAFGDPIGIGGKLSFILIMLAETVGSALVILGLFTRLGAFSLLFGMGVAAFIVHAPFSLAGSELPLLYFVVFAALTISGGGRYSADYYIWKYASAASK